jgi:3-oxoacyl-ACP reductase-like protein
MKPWWVLLFACTSEPKPAPVAASPPAAPAAEPADVNPEAASVLLGVDPATGEASQRPGADLAQQITDVRDGGKSTGGTQTIGGIGSSDGTVVIGGGASPSMPRGRILVLEKQAFDNTTVTAEVVAAKIRSAYITGIQRCYRAYLQKDPKARGELVLKLTVDTSGHAIDATARGVATDVDDCIQVAMAAWRFPVPQDPQGNPVIAAFQIKLGVVPD